MKFLDGAALGRDLGPLFGGRRSERGDARARDGAPPAAGQGTLLAPAHGWSACSRLPTAAAVWDHCAIARAPHPSPLQSTQRGAAAVSYRACRAAARPTLVPHVLMACVHAPPLASPTTGRPEPGQLVLHPPRHAAPRCWHSGQRRVTTISGGACMWSGGAAHRFITHPRREPTR